MPDFEKLVEKDVKHCGDLYEIAKDLGVDDTIAHKLKRYKSMQNILEMTKPDLKVVELAKVLFMHKRVAAVKLLYEKVKDEVHQLEAHSRWWKLNEVDKRFWGNIKFVHSMTSHWM